MPQHKAATDVTIAKADDRSEFGEWILSNWKLMASLAVLVAIAILTFQYVREQRKEALTTSWNKVWAHVEPGGSMAGFTGDAEALASTFPELEKTQVGPWALYLQAKIHGEKREYQAGVEALRKLQDLYPAHPLTTERYAFGGEGPPLTIAERLLQSLRAQGQWEQGREHLFGNPSPPTDAPRVQLETSEGAIVVQLYPDRAPKHVDNFLKLVRNGFYTGTRFHRVEPGFMIQGGDPTSKEDDRSLWGTGGPEIGRAHV